RSRGQCCTRKPAIHRRSPPLVPGAGVEPAWPRGLGILSPLCLPVSPPGPGVWVRELGGGGRNRTGVDGFAGRCMTTLPPRPEVLKPRTAKRCSRDSGAGNESRTRDLNLGKVALYQLSYSREITANFTGRSPCGQYGGGLPAPAARAPAEGS